MANRNQYTYTPQSGKTGSARNANSGARPQQQQRRPANAAQTRGQQPARKPVPRKSAPPAPGHPTKDLAMLAVILFVLPLIGIIGIFYQPFLWVLIVVSVICLAVLWLMSCFANGTRAFFSGVLGVVAVIALIAAIDLTPKTNDYPTYGSNLAGANPGVLSQADDPSLAGNSNQFNASPTAPVNFDQLNTNTGGGDLNAQIPQLDIPTEVPTNAGFDMGTEPTQAPVNASLAEAQAVLEQYMQGWKDNNYKSMVDIAWPTWRSQQQAPEQQLYWAHNWWNLRSWQIITDTGMPSEESATFKVIAEMSKSNSAQSQVKMAYDALVFNVNGKWYVDPDSLRNGVDYTSQETPTGEDGDVNAVHTPDPDPTIPPSTQLWYNGDGGSYYHAEKECKEINPKYYGSMKSVTYEQLSGDDKTLSKLKPCTKCNAPKKGG